MTNSGIDLTKINALPKVERPQGEKPPSKQYAPKPGVFTFYKLNTVPGADKSFKITKFNSDLEVESSYFMNYIPSTNGGYYDCQCPASKFDCRHKAIMKSIVDNGQVDSSKFLCFETKMFKEPTEIQ